MSFDPATLPDRQWLKLAVVVNFLALNEVQDETAMDEAGSPSDRLYSTRAEQARIRCLDETGTDPKHAPFAKVINSPGFWNIDPLAPHLDECKASWTPSGQCLFDLVVGWEHARGKEIERREAARTQVEHWFASGKVVFKGHRLDEEGQDMGLERIGGKSSEEIGIFWDGDFISATTRATTLGTTPPGTYRARRVWDRVCIKRASLVSYLSGGPGEPEVEPEENAPVEQLPDAFVLDVDASAPATATKGAPPKFPWPAFLAEVEDKMRFRGDFDPSLEVKWNQAALERLMKEWAIATWGCAPGKTRLRTKVKEGVARYRAGFGQ